jgi:hypothetical protein
MTASSGASSRPLWRTAAFSGLSAGAWRSVRGRHQLHVCREHTVAGHTLTAQKEGEPEKITEVGVWRAFGTSLDTFERIS